MYSKIVAPGTTLDEILNQDPAAIILSGGPSSIYEKNAPDFDFNILNSELPILGICYGLHLLAHYHGGKVSTEGKGEYGFAEVNILVQDSIFKGVQSSKVWMRGKH